MRAPPPCVSEAVGPSIVPKRLLGFESRHLESRAKAAPRLVLEWSAGWASPSSRGLCGGGAAIHLLLETETPSLSLSLTLINGLRGVGAGADLTGEKETGFALEHLERVTVAMLHTRAAQPRKLPGAPRGFSSQVRASESCCCRLHWRGVCTCARGQ